ncbi:hypothetical protein LRR18_06330 [Mangrovimonas sp. AS39]|uniref:hypothetical protein n=1 Tax=Mangrovimonas TaxID=1211036 RepID=UPI00141DC2F2|nr:MULTISPECIES: hypothetical protein [Mangrovimonas]MCF1191198.1 hypothetical protein [Mangrovimonas futianensis]MCF1194893.1 hypothetical protein [Mangrovimonas futianensis]MCF1421431.1 hypothetical protein [Mangrovimonas futianensis]NIK92566.1 hypothetical protein [Mangrovimonas sp. CR14]
MIKKIFLLLLLLQVLISCSTKKKSDEAVKKVYPAERFGQLNRSIIDSVLQQNGNIRIDSHKPLVIIYYPGKDKCNSSGTSTRQSTEVWYNQMEIGINKIKPSNILYVYKDSTGLFQRNDGFKDWKKDPNEIIEKTFFKEHPPCSGYVLVSDTGRYISCLAEFDKKFLWQRLEQLVN